MTLTRMASFVLAAALLPTTAILAQDAPDRGSPPPTRPSGGDKGGAGDGVRGPRVPGGAGLGDSGFGERGGAKGGREMRGQDGDATGWMRSLESISKDFTPEQTAQIKTIKDEWAAENTKWRDTNGAKMKEIQGKIGESRKAGGTPDPALLEEMRKLGATRPKFEASRNRIAALLTPPQLEAHKAAMDAMKKKMEEGKARGERGGRPGGDGADGKPGRGGAGEGGRPGRGRDGAGGGTGRGTGGGTGSGGTGGNDKPAAPPAGE